MPDVVEAVINQDPALKVLFEQLVQRAQELGPVIVEPKQTSVHLRSRAAFVGVHPRRGYLLLQIVTDEPIASERVVKVDRVSAKRVHNHVRLASTEELDDELMAWLG